MAGRVNSMAFLAFPRLLREHCPCLYLPFHPLHGASVVLSSLVFLSKPVLNAQMMDLADYRHYWLGYAAIVELMLGIIWAHTP